MPADFHRQQGLEYRLNRSFRTKGPTKVGTLTPLISAQWRPVGFLVLGHRRVRPVRYRAAQH